MSRPPILQSTSQSNHPLPAFAFVIFQLSSLLLTTCSDNHSADARQQLLFALSNVLYTSLHAVSPTPSSLITPAVQATPAPTVPLPTTESPSSPIPTAPLRSDAPSPAPSLTIRVLTPVQPLTPPRAGPGESDAATALALAHHLPPLTVPQPHQLNPLHRLPMKQCT